MLDPQDRTLLRDALRPPLGYSLDRVVLTTFSLDLVALLTVPVAFTVFQLQSERGTLAADPLALAESLRRYARKMTVFCQAGQIYVPKRGQLLLSYLEAAVVEVTSPRGGVFHPKLTILRYTADGTQPVDQPSQVTYRVLCSSRNLTFDRSWDTLLVLEGNLAEHRTNAFKRNHPLARFVRTLPELSIHPPSPETSDQIRTLADELLRVDFQTPEGFDELAFCPIGVEGGETWPVRGRTRTLTVAPFVQDEFLTRLAADGGEHQLVSRIESLNGLAPETLNLLSAAWYMNPAADPVSTADDEQATSTDISENPAQDDRQSAGGPDAGDADGALELAPAQQLSGLHAKLFISDERGSANVWTGSANATAAAFEKNIEFLVRLTGSKSRFGVGAFLRNSTGGDSATSGHDRATSFADLLMRYERTTVPEADATRQLLEQALEETRRLIATSGIQANVEPLAGEASTAYRVILRRTAEQFVDLPSGVSVVCRPVTLQPTMGIALSAPIAFDVATFGPLPFEAITSFFAFQVTATQAATQLSCGFVLNLPLTGTPEDREGRILLGLLRNRRQLLRYLLMLLADDDEGATRVIETLGNDKRRDSDGRDGGFGLPLLEPLLQALDRQPSRIDQIARLIDDLRQTPEGCELVNDEFLAIWEPIWAARRRLSHE